MGIIARRVPVRGDRSQLEALALFDTGASRCLIRRDLAQAVSTLTRLPRPVSFETAKVATSAVAEEGIFAEVVIDGHTLSWDFYAVPDLTEELIVGADFMQSYKIRLDPEHETITIDPMGLRLRLG